MLSSKNISLKKGDEALRDGVKRDYGVTGQLKSLPENHAIHAVPRRPKGGIGYIADEPRVTAAEDEHHRDLQKTGLHQPADR